MSLERWAIVGKCRGFEAGLEVGSYLGGHREALSKVVQEVKGPRL